MDLYGEVESTLQPHVFVGALAGATLVLLYAAGVWDSPLVLILLVAIFIGIAVDVVAHGYEH